MGTLTTFQIAEILNVDISTVIDWIDAGKIIAFRTPGGHRRVKPSDLLNFLKTYKMPIPEKLNVTVGLLSRNTANGNSSATKKILIVDDDKNILEFISRTLKKLYKNIKTELASDGFMAGKKIAEFKPNLLILDIKMPGMDGFAVLEHLKKENMKILAITGYPSKETKEKILKAGADDYLVKPFTIEELKERIEKFL